MSMAPISIAMATYNGERYLEAQLRSLAEQTVKPLELIVCDDGSTDGTLAILEGFAARPPFEVRIHANEARLGFANNFLETVKRCSGEWIGFCDQDDVWLPNKLAVVFDEIARTPSLLLVTHSGTATNENLEPLGLRQPDFKNNYIAKPLEMLSYWAGFSMVFRADLLDKGAELRQPRNEYDGNSGVAHDRWIYMLASVFGEIACISEPLALYRRHSNAVTGLPQQRGLLGLATGSTVRDESWLKEMHYREWSEILSEDSMGTKDLNQKTSEAARFFSRVADAHQRRREVYESGDNALWMLTQATLRGDYKGVTTGRHRKRDLFLDAYRLFVTRKTGNAPA